MPATTTPHVPDSAPRASDGPGLPATSAPRFPEPTPRILSNPEVRAAAAAPRVPEPAPRTLSNPEVPAAAGPRLPDPSPPMASSPAVPATSPKPPAVPTVPERFPITTPAPGIAAEAPPTRSPRMAELLGTQPAEPRIDEQLATEMVEQVARAVANEPAKATLGGIIEIRARPAALWQRITAFIIDGALIGGVLALYVGLAAALIGPHGPTSTQLTGIDGVMARVHQLNSVLAPCVALALVLGLVYAGAFALLWNGRTPGRRLLGIRLVDQTGLAPTPGRAITRSALAVVSFLPFLAGFWLALFDRRGQTLHDKLTQTFVVRPG